MISLLMKKKKKEAYPVMVLYQVVFVLTDSETAAEYLEQLQAQLWETGDHSRDDDIASIICMLDSPLFKQLLNLQVHMSKSS